MIIPFFISHQGCPHQCVFCNQNHISGQAKPPDASAIHNTITQFLKTAKINESVDVAFYGGSFTALSINIQNYYLDVIQPFIASGKIKSIRLSTRPDAINHAILKYLKTYHVQTVELGIQSMKNSVLFHSMRGHTATDTKNAVRLLREHDFTIGLQLMVGLPGDSAHDAFMNTVRAVIRLRPDFVRIYPTLVLKDTPLEELYKSGEYRPLSLNRAILLCGNALELFEQAGITVIRIGLQPDRELAKSGIILAGPYHPAFRQLVESSILLDKMRATLHRRIEKKDEAVFAVAPNDLSAAIGQHRSNIKKLKGEFALHSVRIVAQNHCAPKRTPLLL